MLLVADIGNTNIKFGVFDGSSDKLIGTFAVSSCSRRTPDEYSLIIKHFLLENNLSCDKINCAVSSVVPSLTYDVSCAFKNSFGTETFMIGTGTRTGFPIKIDTQSQLGADIVSNTAAALNICKPPFAVVDIGTATTITCVDSAGALIGTVIAPGLSVSLDGLKTTCALLTDINFEKPAAIIGKNSQASIQSGAFWGHIYMIDGFVRQIRDMLCDDGDKLSLVGTGGLSDKILPFCRNKFEIDPNLTLKGAASLYYHNTAHSRCNYTK